MRLGRLGIELQRALGARLGLAEEIRRLFDFPSGSAQQTIRVRQSGVRRRVRRVDRNRALEVLDRLARTFFRGLLPEELAAQAQLVRGKRRRRGSAFGARALQRQRQRVGDLHRDLPLNGQHVRYVAVVALGPQVRHVRRLDELGGNAHPRPRPADAAFQHVVDAEILADLADVLARILVEHRCRASDDAEVTGIERAELGDHFFREAVAEELLLGVVAQILKWQDRQSGARRSRR